MSSAARLTKHDSARCPKCKELGSFDGLEDTPVVGEVRVWECDHCKAKWRRP